MAVRNTIKPIRTKLWIWTTVLIMMFFILYNAFKILCLATKDEKSIEPKAIKLVLTITLAIYFVGFVFFLLAF
jgi:hypothetical protein